MRMPSRDMTHTTSDHQKKDGNDLHTMTRSGHHVHWTRTNCDPKSEVGCRPRTVAPIMTARTIDGCLHQLLHTILDILPTRHRTRKNVDTTHARTGT